MKPIAVGGVILLIVGLVVLGVGAALWTSTPSQVSTSVLGTQQYVVRAGDEISITTPPLTAGQRLTGTFTQNNGTTTYFYFMTPDQQHDWGNCAPCSSPAIVNASNPHTYNFDWTITKDGTYFLILDNSNGKVESVSLTAYTVTTNNSLGTYEAIVAVGAVIAVVGVAALALGLRGSKKTP